MPRIVAALEAAGRIEFVHDRLAGAYGEYNEYWCGACGNTLSDGHMAARGHADDCAGVALAKAMSDAP